jgi:hypothetical protein
MKIQLDNQIMVKIKDILSKNFIDKANVSDRTKEAQQLLKQLEKDLSINTLSFEEPVKGADNEKFDIFDAEAQTVYEIKLSGKNIGHEYYKDLFKVLVHNKSATLKIKRFVFVTEKNALIKFRSKKLLSQIELLLKPEFELDFIEF